MPQNAARVKVSLLVETAPAFGRGHLSRSLLLAEALTDLGAVCHFYVTHPVEDAALHAHGISILGAARPPPCDIFIVDGYFFKDSLFDDLKREPCRLVVIDDLGDRYLPADVILNHNIYAQSLEYAGHAGTCKLLGPGYCLVRPGFFAIRQRPPPEQPSILLTLGGGPAARVAGEIGHCLAAQLRVRVDVLSGSAIPSPEARTPLLRQHGWSDLAPMIVQSTLVVCGLGVTFLEALASGRPVIGVQVADNQRLAYAAARNAGYCVLDRLSLDEVLQSVADYLGRGPMMPVAPFLLDPDGPRRAAAAILGV